MKHTVNTAQGLSFVVRTDAETDKRLATTCFDSLAGHPYAGRFALWKSLQEAFMDTAFLAAFLEFALPVFRTLGKNGAYSLRMTLVFGFAVGWESTASRTDFAPSELEPFRPNDRTTALRVTSTASRYAPRTNLVTLACRFTAGPKGKACDVYTIYPGSDVGSLSERHGRPSDFTARTGRVFFAFEQPGESLS